MKVNDFRLRYKEQEKQKYLKQEISLKKKREKWQLTQIVNDIKPNQIYSIGGIHHTVERIGKLKLLEIDNKKYVILYYMKESFSIEFNNDFNNGAYRGLRYIPITTKEKKYYTLETFAKYIHTGYTKRIT